MLGKSHVQSGVLASVIFAQVVHATVPEIVLGALLIPGASLISDIDCASSTVSRTFGPLTGGLSWVVRKVTGGHRRGTHSIAGVAILALVVQAALDHRSQVWSTVVLSLVLALCMAGPLRVWGVFKKIKGWADDLLPIPVAVGVVMWDLAPLRLLPMALALGIAVHVLGDVITVQGVPVLWPIRKRSYRLARLRAGGPTERWILRPMFLVSIPVAACWTWIDPYWVTLLAGLGR